MKNITFIEGKNCNTKENLFLSFAKELNFEDYFSHNWDSFEEILNDLYLPTENHLIYINDYHLVLENDLENLEIFENIIKDSNLNNDYQFHKVMGF